MSSDVFSALEIDAIGEILNISLGASATAVSTMLNARVDITTPIVNVVSKEEFEIERIEPAVGVEITYITGLKGSNVMLLKRHDVKVIVEMLMGIEISDEEFELDEMNISAVCEVMNQMMGASSTALSEFLGRMVNISTPISFELKDEEEFIEKYFVDDRPWVVVAFTLKIADKLESEFFNVMPIDLAKSLVQGFLPAEYANEAPQLSPEEPVRTAAPVKEEPAASSGGIMSQEEIERLLNGGGSSAEPEKAAEPVPEAAPQPAEQAASQTQTAPQSQQSQVPASTPGTDMSQMEPQMQMNSQMMQMQMQMMQQMMQQMMANQNQASKEPKTINVQPSAKPNLTQDPILESEQEENMELIMGVPLEISVEIGRTHKLVKDILDFTKGSLVVLDKLAGEQVDLLVNGRCIAKGDVVVVEDNFGIRITEILKPNILSLE